MPVSSRRARVDLLLTRPRHSYPLPAREDRPRPRLAFDGISIAYIPLSSRSNSIVHCAQFMPRMGHIPRRPSGQGFGQAATPLTGVRELSGALNRPRRRWIHDLISYSPRQICRRPLFPAPLIIWNSPRPKTAGSAVPCAARGIPAIRFFDHMSGRPSQPLSLFHQVLRGFCIDMRRYV